MYCGVAFRLRFDGWSYVLRLSVNNGASERLGQSTILHLELAIMDAEQMTETRLARLTIAVDCAMSAWLLPITFDFLASTLVACAGYTPPLLQRVWL